MQGLPPIARNFRLCNYRLTTLLGVLSNLVSNDISLEIPFPAGNSNFDLVRDATMLLTIIAPVLTAVLSFLRFDEKSGMHHNAGARFASIKRGLHLMISECNSGCDPDKVKTELKKICEKWDALTLQAPALYLDKRAFNESSDEVLGCAGLQGGQNPLYKSSDQI